MGIESSRWANFFIVSLTLLWGFSSEIFLPRCFEKCQIDPKAWEDIIILLRILFLISDIRHSILTYPQARKSNWHGFQLKPKSLLTHFYGPFFGTYFFLWHIYISLKFPSFRPLSTEVLFSHLSLVYTFNFESPYQNQKL